MNWESTLLWYMEHEQDEPSNHFTHQSMKQHINIIIISRSSSHSLVSTIQIISGKICKESARLPEPPKSDDQHLRQSILTVHFLHILILPCVFPTLILKR